MTTKNSQTCVITKTASEKCAYGIRDGSTLLLSYQCKPVARKYPNYDLRPHAKINPICVYC